MIRQAATHVSMSAVMCDGVHDADQMHPSLKHVAQHGAPHTNGPSKHASIAHVLSHEKEFDCIELDFAVALGLRAEMVSLSNFRPGAVGLTFRQGSPASAS